MKIDIYLFYFLNGYIFVLFLCLLLKSQAAYLVSVHEYKLAFLKNGCNLSIIFEDTPYLRTYRYPQEQLGQICGDKKKEDHKYQRNRRIDCDGARAEICEPDDGVTEIT